MFIFNANTYAKNPAGVGKTVEDMIKAVDGEILASRLWNEQKLAYPINGHRKGAYWLTYARLESTSVTKLNRACQLNDSILRQLVIKIDPRLVDTMVAVAKGEAVPGTEEDGEAGETPAVESAEAAPAT
jgi:small subunit ribosomal protein S6